MIGNRLRAFTPWPGAFTFLPAESLVGRASPRAGGPGSKPQLIKIWKAEVVEEACRADLSRRSETKAEASERRRGEILAADKAGILVGCGGDALRILELQREGGRRLSAADFLAGHPLKAGEKFV